MAQKREEISSKIKREVRRQAAFGCVACGVPIIEYHHIVPWSEVKKHEIANLVALCPSCHQKVHNKLININKLRECKQQPYNKKALVVKDKLCLHDIKKLTLFVGGAKFNDISTIMRISEKDIIYFKRKNKETTLNAVFFNKNGVLEAEIKDNEWIVYVGDNTWDIKYPGGTLSITNKVEDMSLNLDINMETNYIKVTGKMYYQNYQIIMKKEELVIKNTLNNQEIILNDTSFGNSYCAINIK